ncbi:MAG: hypothetical protein U0599_13480 [Vicinamibacteria bacterium]
MSLLEAFRTLAPIVGDPRVDEPRRAAMGVLYEKLKALARVDPRLEDAPAVVITRLQRNGPRPDDARGSDEEVEHYLRRALRNFRIDREREAGRRDDFDERWPARDPARPRAPRLDLAELARAGRELARAFDRLFGEVLPGCKSGTIEAIRIRRQVAEGRATFDDCVREASGTVTKQTRDAFYQRQTRAMRDLSGEVEAFLASRALTGWEEKSLRVALEYVKDAEAGWLIGGGA